MIKHRIRFIAKDVNGVPRVWGEGPTAEIAESRCIDTLREYVQGRRDLRLDQFTIAEE